jgi:hypothetical protein
MKPQFKIIKRDDCKAAWLNYVAFDVIENKKTVASFTIRRKSNEEPSAETIFSYALEAIKNQYWLTQLGKTKRI